MLAVILALAFAVAHVSTEIPPYINVCGRRDPNLDNCILKNIENLRGKLCEGIPELNTQPLQRMYLKKIDIINTDNTKIFLNDVVITGLCDFDINSFHMDMSKLHFDVDLTFKRINLNMTYDFNVNIIMPIKLKGPISIITENMFAKAGSDLKITNKDDKEYVYLSDLSLDLDIKGYNADFNSFDSTELKQMQEIRQNFLGQSQEEILKVLKPILEKVIIKYILSISNNIVKNFTYDELFPDKE